LPEITASIGPDGSIAFAEGGVFTVTHMPGSGSYVLTFGPGAFMHPPVATVTPATDGYAFVPPVVVNPDGSGSIAVELRSGGDKPVDSPFSIVVVVT
jgi:hypothetical protein